jgi:hypothetical protein
LANRERLSPKESFGDPLKVGDYYLSASTIAVGCLMASENQDFHLPDNDPIFDRPPTRVKATRSTKQEINLASMHVQVAISAGTEVAKRFQKATYGWPFTTKRRPSWQWQEGGACYRTVMSRTSP